jgi:penicillin-insensitive murein DD-endopeptidase
MPIGQRLCPLILSAKNRLFWALGLAALLFVSSSQESEAKKPLSKKPSATALKKHKNGRKRVTARVVQTSSQSARVIFGAEKSPANISSRAIGSYARGCLAGATPLEATSPAWQVMRPSRNRNWGHPDLIALVERLARESKENDGWPGLLVGDIAQPRGGPMLSGHASHQIGLDADIWLTPMPDRVLTAAERESMSATVMTRSRTQINPNVWTEKQGKLIKRAASYPQVARIFVHPPIKAELCKWATGDRSWLAKVRPYFGHNYHFHIRMKCPEGFAGCKNQWTPNPKDGTGCSEELAYWMSDLPWKPKKRDPKASPPKPEPPLTMSSLPAECRAVVAAP